MARALIAVLVVAVLGAVLAQHDVDVDADADAKVSYEGAQVWRVVATTKKCKDEILKLEDSGDIALWGGLARNASTVDVLVKTEAEAKVKEFLAARNLSYEVVIENLQRAIDDENPPTTPDAELEGRKGHRMTWNSYHRLADIHGYLDYMAQTFPDICSVQTIGSSVEGRPLKLLAIKSGKPNAPAMWIDGGIHAREWISPASVTYLINELVERREQHGAAVQGVDFYIHSVANPDGYEHSHERDRLWRKNRGNKAAGLCSGVDLNRNFGYKWGGPGSSKQPCKETYAGSNQFSEPETQAISSFVMAKASTLKQELKARESESETSAPLSARTSVALASEREALIEKVASRDETIEKLKIEIEVLKNVKPNTEKTVDELKKSNIQLADEVEKLQKLLNATKPVASKAKSSKSSNDASMSVSVLERKLNEQKSAADLLRKELLRATEELEARKQTMAAVVSGSRTKAEALEAKIIQLQAALEREKALAGELKEESSRERVKLHGLDRQVKEMEQRLSQRPAQPVEVKTDSDARTKHLQNKIRQLEGDLQSAKSELDMGVKNIHAKYIALKEKYEHNVASLSLELTTWKNEANIWKEAAELVKSSSAASSVVDLVPQKKDAWQMVTSADLDPKKKEPLTMKDLASAKRHIGTHIASNRTVKEDAHLLATIRGLNNELDAKRKTFRLLEKKLSDANLTNKRLQAEREKFLSQQSAANPTAKVVVVAKGNKKAREDKENDAEVLLDRMEGMQQIITSLQAAGREKDDRINVITKEYRELGEKRLQDLEEMQKEHIAEMTELAAGNSGRNSDPLVFDMKEQIITQQQVINRLREQLRQLDDCQAEIMVLKVEREHLEKSLVEANRKVASLRLSLTPEQEYSAQLMEKMEQLELRHECREQKLQGIVRDLLRQIQNTGGSDDASALRQKLLQKNKEICFYKTEVDKYIARVMEVEEMLSSPQPYVISH